MDEETRARIEALEMVAIGYLAAQFGADELSLVLEALDAWMVLRRKVAALPPGWEFGDAALAWRKRLVRLALEALAAI